MTKGPEKKPAEATQKDEFESILETNNIARCRDLMYRLIVGQMFYDGHAQLALKMNTLVAPEPPCTPSDRLLHLLRLGLDKEKELDKEKQAASASTQGGVNSTMKGVPETAAGLDLEFQSDVPSSAPEPAQYETAYVTAHKGMCRSGAFSPDGQLCATGSVDASIKILDVDRMLAKSAPEAEAAALAAAASGQRGERENDSFHGHPVIRTLYDHMEEVTTLQFHPKQQILASGSRDHTVKLFDFSKTSSKKAFRSLTDADQVRSICFHPSGDYLLVATNHPATRLYDVRTGQCFVCAISSHHHSGPVLQVRYSLDGKMFVTCSRDGTIKIWDGVSNKCVNTFAKAHEGTDVCSVEFSKNGKYVLSSGKDSLVKLWELTSARCLIAYTGAGTTGKQEHRAHAVFNHTEDYVLYPDEATVSLCCWDARNAARKQLLSLGHNGPVRYICHSPCTPAFLTCSEDFRARFWYKRAVPNTH